jgi:hypothetical protein
MRHTLHPQLQQLLTLLVLFVLGKYYACIHIGWIQAAGLLFFSGVVEHLLLFFDQRKRTHLSYSAFSTAIGVMLMLVTYDGWILGVVTALALMQKHFIRVHERHFFNPSNFALIVGMILFYRQAHIVLGQLGDDIWLRLLVVVLAMLILVRVDRWLISVVFVLSYLLFEYLFVVHYDPVMTFEEIYERFYAVSFVVFVAFMLTDPRTTPDSKWYQVLFGGGIAIVAAWMDRHFGFRVQHLFMVLFLFSVWVPFSGREMADRKKIFFVAQLLFFLAVGAIIFIENQPPYYFDMQGT